MKKSWYVNLTVSQNISTLKEIQTSEEVHTKTSHVIKPRQHEPFKNYLNRFTAKKLNEI